MEMFNLESSPMAKDWALAQVLQDRTVCGALMMIKFHNMRAEPQGAGASS